MKCTGQTDLPGKIKSYKLFSTPVGWNFVNQTNGLLCKLSFNDCINFFFFFFLLREYDISLIDSLLWIVIYENLFYFERLCYP